MKLYMCLVAGALVALLNVHAVNSAKAADAVCSKAAELAEAGKLDWCSPICAVSGRDNNCLVDLCTALEDVCEADSAPAFASSLLKNTLNAYGIMAETTTDLTAQEFSKTVEAFLQSEDKSDASATVKELENERAEALLTLGEGKEGATQFAAQVVENPDDLAQRVMAIGKTLLGGDSTGKRGIRDWFNDNVDFKFTVEDKEKAKDTIKEAISQVKDTAQDAITAFGKAVLNALNNGGEKRDLERREGEESIEEILQKCKAKIRAKVKSATKSLSEL